MSTELKRTRVQEGSEILLHTSQGTFMDKSHWGDGPWQSEGDEYSFYFFGYDSIIRRQDNGSLAGFILVPRGHPWHVDNMGSPVLTVGGIYRGINFMAEYQFNHTHTHRNDDGLRLPILSKPGWYIGFHGGHEGFDYRPADAWKRNNPLPIEYRSFAFMAEQLNHLSRVCRQVEDRGFR